ncbi:MAG: RDD family protein [Pyrinomonadaceae bacterium]|nr:RDD family protein [Pyrinomonadaceae bacterium]
MQCAACRAEYPNSSAECPRCQVPTALAPTAASAAVPLSGPETKSQTREAAPSTSADQSAATEGATTTAAPATTPVPAMSALIEFPGKGRPARPQWRKDLSERVREIQQRRAHESAQEAAEAPRRQTEQPSAPATVRAAAPQLGLVPPVNAPAINPLVVAALKRIERARQTPLPPIARGAKRGTAAAALIANEQYEEAIEALLPPPTAIVTIPVPPVLEATIVAEPAQLSEQHATTEGDAEAGLTPALVVVPPQSTMPPSTESITAEKPAPRHINVVIDDNYLTRKEAETTHVPAVSATESDDRAPLPRRVAAGLFDLVIVALIASPSAAVIELTNGNWSDVRVAASLTGVVITIMFLYLTVATAVFGRTVGQRLWSLRTVDARNGLIPTVGQCARRAVAFTFTLAATAGLALLYAFIDAENRAAHDHFSGTITVRE